MRGYEKEIQESFLDDEEAVLKRLRATYEQGYKDITSKITGLDKSIDELQKVLDSVGEDELGDLATAFFGEAKARNLTPEQAKETLQSRIQSKVYQKKYQSALKKQVGNIATAMYIDEYKTISEYLEKCYEGGFVGAMYSLQKQDIPLCFPLDQKAMTRAITLDSKISKGLYSRLGEDVAALKKTITAEISRGISTGMNYDQIAQQIKGRMVGNYDNVPGGALYRAQVIARTEGHRIQCQSAMDACYTAQQKGAIVYKQWDSTLDGRTRYSHRVVDGEIRALDKAFSNKLQYPGDPGGGAAEVVNCRCALLQRAKWALDEKELETLKERAAYFGLDKTKNFEEFKKKYLSAAQNVASKATQVLTAYGIISKKAFQRVETSTSEALERNQVDYNPVAAHQNALTTDEVIALIAGGDKTTGSCASVALAYAGQKQGWNVLDFRGGASLDFFSRKTTKVQMFKDLGVKSIVEDSAKSNLTNGKRILGQLEDGKEYYLSVGRHAAIVRNRGGTIQYLELQSPLKNGWTDFGDLADTLRDRFGCTSSTRYYPTAYATDISQLTGDDFRTILGYINTDTTSQRKGAAGSVK